MSTPDTLTHQHSANPEPASRAGGSRRRPRLRSWLSSFDPGRGRLLFAVSGALSVGLAIAAEYLFVRWTGALHLDVPPGAPAAAAVQIHQANHSLLVIAEVLGVLVAVCCAMSAGEATARQQLATISVIPLPMAAGLTCAVALNPYRMWDLVTIVGMLGVAGYVRTFGARGIAIGFGLFMGYFIGFTVGNKISVSQLGWLIAEIGVGLAVAMVVKLALFRPNPRSTARRLLRSFEDCALDVLRFAETTLQRDDAGAGRSLRRRLLQINQSRLVLDAAVAQPNSIGQSPHAVQEWAFDVENAVGQIGHAAVEVARRSVPAAVRSTMQLAVFAVRHDDLVGARALARELKGGAGDLSGRHVSADSEHGETDRAAVNRFADAVLFGADALEAWWSGDPGRHAEETHRAPLQPMPMISGWLPGTAMVSARASVSGGSGHWYTQLRLGPHLRAAIQMMVAGAIAIVVGDRLSGAHFFWAVLTVYLLFMGPTNAAEQVSRSVLRVLSTALGLAVAVLIVHLFGDNDVAAVTVVIASTLAGLYFARVNPAFLVFAFTVMTAQLFVQLHQYSHALLRMRIEEIAVGGAAVIVTVLLVVPLHHQRLMRMALRAYLASVADLLAVVGEQVAAEEVDDRALADEVKSLVRRVDGGYHSLLTSVSAAARPPFGAPGRRARGVAAAAYRSHRDARLVAALLRRRHEIDVPSREALSLASRRATESTRAILQHLDSGNAPEVDPVPSAHPALLSHQHDLLASSALTDLDDLDTTLSALAGLVGLPRR